MIEPVKAGFAAASLAMMLLGGCGSEPAADRAEPEAAADPVTAEVPATAEPGAPTPPVAGAQTLTLEGYGGLIIGKPVPAGSPWAARGAQASDACLTISAPDWPGAYAIVEQGVVRRITVNDESGAKLVEGIGPGSTEAQVRAAFPSFVAEPHKYVDAPAKYLTQPGADPRLLFEIDEKGKVSLVHVGMMPTLAYVEGCS
ncbi:hypothetical protein [Blastomonas sp. AAP53]|uniref:hypothetical protein n=1 Tax=Blastomonas sp. AAP53 TaxID=1248760 RepID=UPI0009DAD01D|nr:hypothetical protein [Blastomonas sp. AAP53]